MGLRLGNSILPVFVSGPGGGGVSESTIANAYDNAATYNVGDYATYDNKLYKCSTAIVTPEEFDISKWDEVSVMGEIPTAISDLTNDSGFITINDIPAIPSKTSDLQNDSGFITDAGVTSFNGSTGAVTYTAPVTSVNGNTGAVTVSVPSKTSDLQNDSGFITDAGVTSFNGSTGAVTYTAPVTSVNGNTGAVTVNVPSAYTSAPNMDGSASAGSSTSWARGDHRHPSDTSKQATLVSGTNIKTINGNSILGSGNITIETASSVDSELSPTSVNPVQNKLITSALNERLSTSSGMAYTDYKFDPGAGISLDSEWSIAYGGNTFAAVNNYNYTGYAAYSSDGISWKLSALPASRTWNAIAYGNGTFVAIAKSSDMGVYSSDGINWTEMSLPASRTWNAIAYGNGTFVAIAGSSDKGAYSSDGINWTEMSLPASRTWITIAYGNGTFVAIAGSSDKGAYSSDGINWTEMSLPASRTWKASAYGNGIFVVISSTAGSANAKFAYSSDGINWTEGGLPTPASYRSAIWSYLAYGNGRFICIADSDSDYYLTVAISTDGTNWSFGEKIVGTGSTGWSSQNNLCFGNGVFIFGNGGTLQNSGFYTEDGLSWENTSILNRVRIDKFAAGEKIVIASSPLSGNYSIERLDTRAYSTDGITWHKLRFNVGPAAISPILHSNNLFVAGDYNNSSRLYISSDGFTWETISKSIHGAPSAMCYIGGKYVLTFLSTSTYWHSENGHDWVQATLPFYPSTPSMISNGNTAVLVGGYRSNTCAYTLDGVTWATTTIPALSGTSAWYSLAYGNGVFVTLNRNSNEAAYSSDGINWTRTTLPATRYWSAVAYGNLGFVAVAESSDKGAYSKDGVNWTEFAQPSSRAYSDICYFKGAYLIAGGTMQMTAGGPNMRRLKKETMVTQNSEDVSSDIASALAPFIIPEADSYIDDAISTLIPTPTIADAGKVLGVDSNGKLAYISIPQ